MDWNVFLASLISGLVSVSIALGAAAFLGKSLVSQLFAKDLEKFKADLEREAHRNRFRFEKLHEERAQIIKLTYQELVDANQSLGSLLQPLQEAGDLTEEQKAEKFVAQANSFKRQFDRNRIFFPEHLASKVDTFISETREAWNLYRLSNDLGRGDHGFHQARKEAWDKVEMPLARLKTDIEKDFRVIFGA